MKDIIERPKREYKIPGSDKIMSTVSRFSPTEKVIFALFACIMTVSSLYLLWNVNRNFLVPIPAKGGALTEGVVGTPRFINPVLALSDVDRDLTTLIYSGLLKVENGKLVPDLTEKYSISPDGLLYTFTLKKDLEFSDGEPLTTDDVEFTIQKAQDAILNSPKRANWDGVTIEKVSPTEIRFMLKRPYAPFLENTTIGILPKHLWKNISAEQFSFTDLNVNPIGSGPYKVKSVIRNSGLAESYILVPFNNHSGGEAYISTLALNFYPNENALFEAYRDGVIESINSISPKDAKELKSPTANIVRAPLPRVFGLFFNQNQAPVLANKEVRQAINMAIDRDKIVSEVLDGYGTPIYSPFPSGVFVSTTSKAIATSSRDQIDAARRLLEKNGWALNANNIYEKKKNKETQVLEFSISTSNAPELKEAAEIVRQQLTAMGAHVTVKIFETGDLNQNVIRPRKFDTLLFGEIVGRDLDLFAFWHSSQRNDPGLNIAMYVNSKVDKLLEEARTTSDTEKRLAKYKEVETAIKEDLPAVFIYSPDFIYILPEKVKGAEISNITTPDDRFNGVNKWFINTDEVWRVFVNE